MAATRPGRVHRYAALAVLVGAVLGTSALRAQSLTEGALGGVVSLDDGTPVPTVSLTLQDQSGIPLRQLRTDYQGRFNLPLLAPGQYILLAEKSGYQPLRQHGIVVHAEARTYLRVRIVRRPPPISAVDEIAVADQSITPTSPFHGEVARPTWAEGFAPRADITEDGRNTALIAAPRDTRWGFAQAAGGLPQGSVPLLVDGLPGTWFRHAGITPEPSVSGLYTSPLFNPVTFAPHATDLEWVGGNGGMASTTSRRGTARFEFSPFATWSSFGARQVENPDDSSLASLQVGGRVSGELVPQKASFVAGVVYESLEIPSASPWEADTAAFGGAGVPLAATIRAIAQDSFGRGVRSQVAPVVRSRRGGAGGFRFDWRLGTNHNLVASANFARYKERSADLGLDLVNESGNQLDAKDFSGGFAVVSAFGTAYANEFRIGYRKTIRDWSAAGLPTTYLVGEGAGIGNAATLPAMFQRTSIDVADAFQISIGAARQHRIKVGGQYSNGHWTQDYVYGSRGIFSFGDLDQFGQAQGSFFIAEAPDTRTRISIKEAGIYGQMVYELTPTLHALGGIRWDRQILPSRQRVNPISPNNQLGQLFGIRNNRVPNDNNNVAPRFGVVWDGGPAREWSASLGFSRQYGQLNPALLSEAIVADGPLTVRRGVGDLGTWPTTPDATVAPLVGQRVTLFSPNDDYKNPRTTKADLVLSRAFGANVTVRAFGGYHHTDFLLRRNDLNILPGPAGRTSEGRPVYGSLVQQGGSIVADPTTNRAVVGFDLVSALVSTGFSDYYEAGIGFSREAVTGLSFSASYVWSRTRDNWLQSWSGDPLDELTPFPEEKIGDEWAEGISDYDLPHRATVMGAWRAGGRAPVMVGARYRYRSGLPFTPGFRPGVDVNADGSGRNDPAFLDPTIPGMSALLSANSCLESQSGDFAARNSCREGANHALDLTASVGLPVRSLGGRLELAFDVFNVVSTETGVVDRAVTLVNPAGSITTNAQGELVLPLVANPRFGKLLSRRTEPRMVRFGLRVAY